jgi:hypothetical protein
VRGDSAFAVLAVTALSCSHARVTTPRAPITAEGLWTYVVDTTAPPRLSVEVTFHGAGDERFVLGLPFEHVSVRRGDRFEALHPDADGVVVAPECRADCTLAYSVALDRTPHGLEEVVVAGQGAKTAFLSPSYAWMVRPENAQTARVRLRFVPTPEARAFNTGALPEMSTRDFGEGSFAAFGYQRRASIDVGGAKIELSILGDAAFALGDAGLVKWAGDAARAVSALYGHFPVPRVAVFAVPVEGADEVVFGKVLSLGGPSIAALVGTSLDAEGARGDWVLVHEMIHLGFPTFLGEGRWLGEGIATYYEPVLRARSGLRDGAETWRGFARSMPRARPHGAELALEKRADIDSVYWGGALFALMADVRIRMATKGARSLDDVMRAVLAKGGDATHVWRVHDVLVVGDEATGTHVMTELHDRLAVRGEPVDPRVELAALGVGTEGVPELRDAPLAWVREAIVSTSPRP